MDGFDVCFVSGTYANWQPAYTVSNPLLPTVAEALNFHRDLDDHYRVRLQRDAVSVHGTPEARVGAIVRYLSYRVSGCDHAEAEGRAISGLDGHRETSKCAEPALTVATCLRSRTRSCCAAALEAALEKRGAPAAPSHIDLDGEAVWLHDYTRLRLAGRDPASAGGEVLHDPRDDEVTRASRYFVLLR